MDRSITVSRRPLAGMVLAIALLLAVQACSYIGLGRGPSNDFRELTDTELQEMEAPDLLSAVRQARPQWLRERIAQIPGGLPNRIIVYLDDVFQGDAEETLETIPIDWVSRIEYLDAAQADGLPNAGEGRILAAFMVYTTAHAERPHSPEPQPPD